MTCSRPLNILIRIETLIIGKWFYRKVAKDPDIKNNCHFGNKSLK
jgi:hypothetical protein